MHRFFVPPESIVGETVALPEHVASQLSRVLRARVGDEIIVLDGTGMEYVLKLDAVDKNQASGSILQKSPSEGEPSIAITLYQGILKADRFEFMLQKGTEVGITTFVPIDCQRTVSQNRPTPARYQRWRKIITEAAEQSRRGRIPVLHEAIDFEVACAQADGPSLIPWEEETTSGLKSALKGWTSGQPISSANIFIGPEGGFTSDEVELARERGITPVTLGKRILRAETAGVVAAAAVLYEMGELGG